METTVCKNYKKGSCTYGDRCRFSHDASAVVTTLANGLSTTTALALIVDPGALCTSINVIRAEHDKAFPRWMPHVNFYFPFVPIESFPAMSVRISAILKSIDPFDGIDLNHHHTTNNVFPLTPN
jgi:hypothetical protein